MPQASNTIFNKKATDKLRNPDDLERYIQVTSPSVWVVLGACIALLAGLFSWGVFGTVATDVNATGAVVGGQAVCYLSAEDVAKVSVGDEVVFSNTHMQVSDIASVPDSKDEAHSVLKSDYLAAALMPSDWAYRVSFQGDTSNITQEVPQSVRITVEQVSPIVLVLENRG